MSERTRLLGIDYGTVRVGLAVSDPDRKIASPLATCTRRNRALDTAYYRQVIEDEAIGQIILGLPIHMSGDESQKSAEARSYGKWLTEITGLPVILWDERFTSVQAEGYLLDAGMTKKRRKERLDRVAAQILLQSYLDAGCPGEGTPMLFDD